jgi:hypothetical protein
MTSAARTIVAAAQLGLLAGLLLVGAAVALRRLAGEPKVPLTPWMLAVTAVGFAAACLLVRLMSRRLQRPTAARWIDQVTHFAPLLACALLVAGALLPGTSLLGACLLVGLLTVEETWCLARPAQDGPRQGVGSQFRDEIGLQCREPYSSRN